MDFWGTKRILNWASDQSSEREFWEETCGISGVEIEFGLMAENLISFKIQINDGCCVDVLNLLVLRSFLSCSLSPLEWKIKIHTPMATNEQSDLSQIFGILDYGWGGFFQTQFCEVFDG